MALLLLPGCGRLGAALAAAVRETPQAPRQANVDVPSAFRCADCNVILISIDTLRADHLHTYGYARDTSPNIDRFAREAVLFEENINTGGGTLPVHTSMFTSLPPTVHGVLADSKRPLASERVTLAEQLRAAGYQTRGYTGGGFVRALYGLGQGFDLFYDQGGNFKVELPMVYDWLRSYSGGKFFLFLHTYDVHSGFDRLPYDHGDAFNRRFTSGYHGRFDGCIGGLCASQLLLALNHGKGVRRPGFDLSPADVEYVKGLYDGGIAYADERLGELFARLKAAGLWDKTLIVLTADHGEEFREHSLMLHEQNHAEIARVPLLIHFPYGAGGGRRIHEMTSTLEIMPTILDVLGIPCNPEVEGRSVVPLVASGAAGRPWVYMAGALETLETPGWTLFSLAGRPVFLYDTAHDPGETIDVKAAHPQLAAALQAHFDEERRRELAAKRDLLIARPDATVQPSTEDRARLRALGYAQ
jgi:arylsulfatase A-like enzyme